MLRCHTRIRKDIVLFFARGGRGCVGRAEAERCRCMPSAAVWFQARSTRERAEEAAREEARDAYGRTSKQLEVRQLAATMLKCYLESNLNRADF